MAANSPTRPIVVGYDGSAPSEAALQWAARAADHQQRGLVVLHAAEQITYTQDAGYGMWTASEVISEAEDVAARGRDTALQSFPDLHIETSGSLFNAKVALGEVSTHASMIVLGSHGRGRLRTLLLGSTAYAIAGYARCPVVIVRDGAGELPGPGRPVVVGVNGSGGSDRAVSAGVEVAREWNAPLVLASTWMPAGPDPWDRGPIGYDSRAEATADYRATAERINAAALDRVGAAAGELQVTGVVIEDRPVDGLVEAARGGLLVLGTRGHGSLVGAILGSTTLGALHHGDSPVMVID